MTSARSLFKTRAVCSCDRTQGKFCSGDLLRARLVCSVRSRCVYRSRRRRERGEAGKLSVSSLPNTGKTCT